MVQVPPQRRADLLLRPFGDDVQHVVKDPRTGDYFNLPPIESFLLKSLDGKQSVGDICESFQKSFNEPLTPEDLEEFLAIVRRQGLLAETDKPGQAPAAKPAKKFTLRRFASKILYYRKNFFDP